MKNKRYRIYWTNKVVYVIDTMDFNYTEEIDIIDGRLLREDKSYIKLKVYKRGKKGKTSFDKRDVLYVESVCDSLNKEYYNRNKHGVVIKNRRISKTTNSIYYDVIADGETINKLRVSDHPDFRYRDYINYITEYPSLVHRHKLESFVVSKMNENI